MSRHLARSLSTVAVAALLSLPGVAAPAGAATPKSSAASTAQPAITTWSLLSVQRSAQGLTITARATQHGDFRTMTGFTVSGMGGCPDVHVLDLATTHMGVARPRSATSPFCEYESDEAGIGDGDSATVTAVVADPGGARLDVVVDDQLLATDVPVTGAAAPTSPPPATPGSGVLEPHLRQVSPELRFTKAGASVAGQSVDLSTDVLFAFDSDVLGPDAGAAIDVAVQQLQAQASRTVTITGHTDSQGDEAYNLGLSQRRAEAVRAALAAKLGTGWTLNATGVGESDPLADESRPTDATPEQADAAVAEAQRVNRRVEVVPG